MTSFANNPVRYCFTLLFLLAPTAVNAHGRAVLDSVFLHLMPFIVLGLIALVLVLFFQYGAGSTSNIDKVRSQAKKLLGNVQLADDYCVENGIALEELHQIIDDGGEVRAFSAGVFIFVQVPLKSEA